MCIFRDIVKCFSVLAMFLYFSSFPRLCKNCFVVRVPLSGQRKNLALQSSQF